MTPPPPSGGLPLPEALAEETNFRVGYVMYPTLWGIAVEPVMLRTRASKAGPNLRLLVALSGANPQEWGYTNPPGKLTPPPGPPEQGVRPNGAEESKMYLKHYLQ